MNPLDQLHDIELPNAISYWPPAWPWWLLLLGLIVLVVCWLRHRKRQAWRKHALKQLASLDWHTHHSAFREANKLLKQISVQKIDSTCARLSGDAWLMFLDTHVKQPIFLPHLRPFAHVLDEPNIQLDAQKLKRAIEQWIRKVTC